MTTLVANRRWIFETALVVALVSLLRVDALTAQAPTGYYDTVNTSSAATLRQTVHDVIDDHTRFPYTANARDTWDILEEADEDPNNPSNILDLYRNESYVKRGSGNADYNREHSWPKSYGFPDDGAGNYPFTDCHHLFLTDSRYNSSRGNNPYRTCDPNCTEKTTVENDGNGGGSGTFPGNSSWRSGANETGRWQNWGRRKGDVARALFYMDVRYEGGRHGITDHTEPNLILTNDLSLIESDTSNQATAHMGQLSVLLAWHAEDPVDDLERNRNNQIFEDQGNRNPFIDHPEWVGCVFQDECDFDPGGDDPIVEEPNIDNLITRLTAIEQEIQAIRAALDALSDDN